MALKKTDLWMECWLDMMLGIGLVSRTVTIFLSTQSSRLSEPLRYILNVSWSWPSLRRLLSFYCYPPGWFRPPNSNLALSFVVMRDKTAEHCKSKKHSDKNRQSPASFVFLNQKWLLHWDCKWSLNKSTKKISK